MASVSQSAGARLRKTFHYPEDSDSDSLHPDRPELDEQEQETLIRSLAAHNAARNAQFHHVLRLLPLLAGVAYAPAVLGGTAQRTLVPSLLALTSLAATSFLVHRLPQQATGFVALDRRAAEARAPQRKSFLAPRGSARAWVPESPLEMYLPYLNLALGVLAGLSGALGPARSASMWWLDGILAALPLAILGVVVGAKMMMAGIDPEELSALRYDYKGA
ncbi:hypothetical protein BROUX41_000213 [Berkeleyomyces rouxiae]|uniref:uncharacterized protein n=1 Tax=Berkeleyomyces rouxiae TaxID=2035830 RepID=UPI003B7CC65A